MTKTIVDAKRANTMRQRLGAAAELVEDDRYLPMFRNRQKRFGDKLFELSVKIAQSKRNPKAYFAKMWSKANLSKTIEILSYILEKASGLARKVVSKLQTPVAAVASVNAANIARYEELKRKLLLARRMRSISQ